MEVSNYSLAGMIIQVMNLGNLIPITDPWDERYIYLHLFRLENSLPTIHFQVRLLLFWGSVTG